MLKLVHEKLWDADNRTAAISLPVISAAADDDIDVTAALFPNPIRPFDQLINRKYFDYSFRMMIS